MDLGKNKGKLNSANRKRWRMQDGPRAQQKAYRLLVYQGRLEKVMRHLGDLTEATASPHEERSIDAVVELPLNDQVDAVAELPPNHLVVELESLPVAELPAESDVGDSRTGSVLAELPCEPVDLTPLKPVVETESLPRIIVTQSPTYSESDRVGSPVIDQCGYESQAINETMAWKQTRNDIRLQQSQSLANIVAEMENARIK